MGSEVADDKLLRVDFHCLVSQNMAGSLGDKHGAGLRLIVFVLAELCPEHRAFNTDCVLLCLHCLLQVLHPCNGLGSRFLGIHYRIHLALLTSMSVIQFSYTT